MKAETITIGGIDYYLIFNGNAMFELNELYGAELVEKTQSNSRESLACLYKAVSILAQQGELVRRDLCYDYGEMLTEDRVRLLTTPADADVLRLSLYRAVTRGYKREVESDQEVDLVLQEIEKKTGKR